MMRSARVLALGVLFAWAAGGPSFGIAAAAPLPYTIDPAQSTFQLTGTFDGAPLNEQNPGSRSVGYTGTLLVDVDRVSNTLSFAATTVKATEQPADQLPAANGYTGANYGFTALGGTEFTQLAVRSFDLYLRADDAPFTGPAPAAEEIGFFINGGTLYYQKIARNVINIDLHGGGGDLKVLGPVTLTTSGNVEKLTIPITTHFSPYMYDTGDTVTFNLSGQVVATRLVPEPAAGVVAAFGLGALLSRRRRRA